MPIEWNSFVTKPAFPNSSIHEYAPMNGGDISAMMMNT
ncbi:MAG: hypothetical protein BWY81_00629 [Firmicutes bacterium ADurb.Bin467]|nr:MAG: hypothetical protein BWY81_00629 [Firmicutes bacterium ADurb.Bin467]